MRTKNLFGILARYRSYEGLKSVTATTCALSYVRMCVGLIKEEFASEFEIA
jgi:hypothetical protein